MRGKTILMFSFSVTLTFDL